MGEQHLEADFDPDLHPRGPDGKFIEGLPDVLDIIDTKSLGDAGIVEGDVKSDTKIGILDSGAEVFIQENVFPIEGKSALLGESVYRQAGVPVPEHRYDSENGRLIKESVPGETLRGGVDADVDGESLRDVYAASLIAGDDDLHTGNIIITDGGKAVPIDIDHSGNSDISKGDFQSKIERGLETAGVNLGYEDVWDRAQEFATRIETDELPDTMKTRTVRENVERLGEQAEARLADLDQFVAQQVKRVEADWDPREHPRGPSGEFIEDPLSVALDAIPLDSEAWASKDSTDIEEGDVMKIVKNPFGGGDGKEEKVARVVDNAIIETYVEDSDGERIEVGGIMSDWENHGIYDPDLAREERIEELEREEPPKVDPEDLDDLPPVQMDDGWQEIPLEDDSHEQVNPGDAVNVMLNDTLDEQRATVDEATSDRVAVTTADGDELSKDPEALEGDFDILHHWDPDEEPVQSVDEGELTPEQRQAVRETLDDLPDIGRPDEPGAGHTPGDPGYFTSDLAQDANQDQATSLAETLNQQQFLGIGYDAEPLESDEDLPEGFKRESELAIFDGAGTPTMDVLMDPEDFLHVSAQMQNEQHDIDQDLWKADVEENRLESLTEVLEGGADPDRGGIPMPVLQTNDTGDLMAFQEGRHRAWAALEAGYDRIPVRIGLDERGDGVQGAEAFVEASLASMGVLAAGWDPDAHPRGPNGQFVESLAEYRQAIKDSIREIDVDSEDERMAERATSKFQDTADEEIGRIKNPVVAENTFSSIGELFVNDFRTGINFQAGREKDSSSFEVQPASRPTTFHHEYGHAIADGHGYGISVDAAREGDMKYNSDQDNFVPVDLDRDDLDEFRLTQLEGDDPPEEVQNLMEAVNTAWEESQRVGQESPDDLEDYVPKTNYGTLNAHEFLAQLHESLQMDRLPENANWFYRYDDLLPAYLEVAEPSDRVKELITFLHNNREGSPFDEDPYPDIEPEM